MGRNFKLKWRIGTLLFFLILSMNAQDQAQETVDELYQVYKNQGAKAVLESYQKNNPNTAYEGMAEPLNILAYRLMQEENDLEAAKILFQAQIDEYPQEANPYDSFSDVLLEMDKKDEAVKYIEKSLAIAEKHDHEQDDLIMEAGLAKIAIIENRDKQLNFLIGNWNNETQVYQNGEVMNTTNSSNRISFDEAGSMLVVDHDTGDSKPCCKRVMVYNPLEDEFDVVFMRRNAPEGISNSKMKVKEMGPDQYQIVESYLDDSNQQLRFKHDITKEDGLVKWAVYEETESGWNKSRTMNLTRKD